MLDIVNEWISRYIKNPIADAVDAGTPSWAAKLDAIYRAMNTDDEEEVHEDEFLAAFKDKTIAAEFWNKFKDAEGKSLDQLKMSLHFKKIIEDGGMSEDDALELVDNWAHRYLKTKKVREIEALQYKPI